MSEPIRVCHLITRLIVGGAQENTLLSAAGLAATGSYDVTVWSGPETGSEGSLHTEAERLGVPVEIIAPLRRNLGPSDVAAYFALRSRWRHPPVPQIVHTHSSKAGLLGRPAARAAGVPIVIHTVHGWPFHAGQSPAVRSFYAGLERWAALRSDALVVVADRDRETGLARGIGRPEQYRTIRSGIDLESFQCPDRARDSVRAELGLPADAIVVGSVTRLSPQKAPLDLLSAWSRVARGRERLWLLLVGDGPLRSTIERAARATGMGSRVILTGVRRDIPELLAAMDLFAISSRWEGLPRVLPQAMVAGKPIVCTGVGGAAEAVTDQVSGLIVRPGDIGALAVALARLIDDPELAGRLGQAGREAACRFGTAEMIRELDLLYRELAGRKLGRGGS